MFRDNIPHAANHTAAVEGGGEIGVTIWHGGGAGIRTAWGASFHRLRLLPMIPGGQFTLRIESFIVLGDRWFEF